MIYNLFQSYVFHFQIQAQYTKIQYILFLNLYLYNKDMFIFDTYVDSSLPLQQSNCPINILPTPQKEC